MSHYIPEIQAAGLVGSIFAFGSLAIRMYWLFLRDRQCQEHVRMLEKQRQDMAHLLAKLGVSALLNSDGSIRTKVSELPFIDPDRDSIAEAIEAPRRHSKTELQRDGP